MVPYLNSLTSRSRRNSRVIRVSRASFDALLFSSMRSGNTDKGTTSAWYQRRGNSVAGSSRQYGDPARHHRTQRQKRHDVDNEVRSQVVLRDRCPAGIDAQHPTHGNIRLTARPQCYLSVQRVTQRWGPFPSELRSRLHNRGLDTPTVCLAACSSRHTCLTRGAHARRGTRS